MKIQYSTAEDFANCELQLNSDVESRLKCFGHFGYQKIEAEDDKYWNPSYSANETNGAFQSEFVGLIQSSIMNRDGRVNIDFLFVNPAFRGRGVGKSLIHRIFDDAKRFKLGVVTLTAFSENEEAIAFYESLGFEIDCKRTKYLFGHPNGHIVHMSYDLGNYAER